MGWIEVASMLLKLTDRNRSTNRGRPCKASDREFLEKIQFVLRTGIQWNRLSGDLHWSTYYKKFCKWSQMGIFTTSFKIVQKILKKAKYLNQSSYRNLYIDSSMIKNIKGSDGVGTNHYDRGRKGSKISIVVTQEGIPLGITLSGSHIHDIRLVEDLVDKITVKVIGSRLIGDKGYNSRRLKTRLANKGIDLIYPFKRNQREENTESERQLLRSRNIVENVFSWQQNNRHIRLRYDRYLINYESFYYIGLMALIDKKISY